MNKLRFTVPVPSSSKNSRILTRTKSGKMKSLPNRRAERSKAEIRAAAIQAMGGIFPVIETDDDIEVHIIHHVPTDTVTVEVISLRPKPKGKTGRGRDLDNLASTVLDALSGLAYGDDRQVALLHVERDYD